MSVSAQETIYRTLDRVLERCAACDQAEVRFSSRYVALSRFSGNNIQQNLSQENAELQLTLVENCRIGSGSTNLLDDEGLDRLVAGARRAATLQQSAANILPLVGSCPTPEKDCLDAETAILGPKQKAESLRLPFELAIKKDLKSSGIYSNEWNQLGIVNSAGLACFYQTSRVIFSTTMHSENSSGWSEQMARSVKGVNVEAVSREARRICLDSREPLPAKPGEWAVILAPACVAELLRFLAWFGFFGQSYVEGTSPLAGKIGVKLFHDSLSIRDDAGHPLTDGMPFDFEGISRRTVPLVEKGVYLGPVHDRVTAAQAGVESTGHGLPRPNPHGPFPVNLVMDGGHYSTEEMIRTMKKGLLVTNLHYTNVQDPIELLLTGITRDVLFLVEDGRVSHAVQNMRFTESLLKVFGNIRELTHEQTLHRGFVVPGMMVEGFRFTSESGF